jgi:lipoprotein-anchoring transpeptidase ErfK/SrfK
MSEAIAAKVELVHYPHNYPQGTIIIHSADRGLYLLHSGNKALRYDVAIGKSGKAWTGVKQIDGKHVRPAWSPPKEVKRDFPHLPNVIEGGAKNNPMGERALTLSNSEYAIHGTNRPETVGGATSYGCFRMRNPDIIDLFERVNLGAHVIVSV